MQLSVLMELDEKCMISDFEHLGKQSSCWVVQKNRDFWSMTKTDVTRQKIFYFWFSTYEIKGNCLYVFTGFFESNLKDRDAILTDGRRN